ncbi:GCN5-related N-acetyltransferase [Thalassoporum mexicanum PCC 7367]|uniref:GNAT family N-acetyltransferase n=1 Tax=Thalassoporum mexicanum TaxID=3457544 RepID=UPI00029F998D|nr:GNAT family N-acetyltransferase [Pseudanabaena sp. PCC 7367]AFY71194.1 GCN5-related N-acetyltransferase [Pseudanabaena sp. PCC 7367]
MQKQSIEKAGFNIRNLRPSDIASLSKILASSFYLEPNRANGFAPVVRWLYPFICWGIAADLLSRLSDYKFRHVCLVATCAGYSERDDRSPVVDHERSKPQDCANYAPPNYKPHQPSYYPNLNQKLTHNLNTNFAPSSQLWLSKSFNQARSGTDRSHHASTPANEAIATVELGLQKISLPAHKFNLFKHQKQYPYISNLAVHPGWRRRGMAQALLRSTEQFAIRWGHRQIFLHVLENNLPARSLYHQLGYELYKVETDLSVWLLGYPRRLLLRKQLK